MQVDEFNRLVREGYDQLPEWVRKKIKNVALLVEDEPTQETRKREHLSEDETLLGYYQGIPLLARGDMYGVGMVMPDTITLYQIPIEKEARDISSEKEIGFSETVRKVVADTIWHEFAHHFGMDEHEVRAREKKRVK